MSYRILIAGWPRAGKTTLAAKLNRKNALEKLPVIEHPGNDSIAFFEIKLGRIGEIGTVIYHTDALIVTHDWSAASQKVSELFDAPGPWIIEGVAVGRALRKWLARNPEGKPCDVIYYLREPRVELTRGQITMGKGSDTVWREIQAALLARGVEFAASPSVNVTTGAG